MSPLWWDFTSRFARASARQAAIALRASVGQASSHRAARDRRLGRLNQAFSGH
jgi:hypothetical protein